MCNIISIIINKMSKNEENLFIYSIFMDKFGIYL
jgi:hypothetical protein